MMTVILLKCIARVLMVVKERLRFCPSVDTSPHWNFFLGENNLEVWEEEMTMKYCVLSVSVGKAK